MNLTLVRHGETEENVAHIVQGQLPGHLTEKGKLQAQQAAEKLRGRIFAAIYCSDLRRCLDTAEPIRKFHAGTPFITDALLRERKGGRYEGKVVPDGLVASLDGDWYTHRLPGGGESWVDVRERQIPFLNKLFAKHPDDSVLIIAHGGPIRGMRSLLERRTLEQIDAEGTPNTGIWEETMAEPLVNQTSQV